MKSKMGPCPQGCQEDVKERQAARLRKDVVLLDSLVCWAHNLSKGCSSVEEQLLAETIDGQVSLAPGTIDPDMSQER